MWARRRGAHQRRARACFKQRRAREARSSVTCRIRRGGRRATLPLNRYFHGGAQTGDRQAGLHAAGGHQRAVLSTGADALHVRTLFQRGLRELIVSNACAGSYVGFEIGIVARSRRRLDRRRSLRPGGDKPCSGVCRRRHPHATFARNSYSTFGRTALGVGLRWFRKAVQTIPTLHLEARHEREVVEDSFKQLTCAVDFVSYFVGTIMGYRGDAGAVNSLYSIVDARRVSSRTLRAIGFGSGAITASILCESGAAGAAGRAPRAGLACALFRWIVGESLRLQFSARGHPLHALTGVVWALAMGLFGGLLPALRAGECR